MRILVELDICLHFPNALVQLQFLLAVTQFKHILSAFEFLFTCRSHCFFDGLLCLEDPVLIGVRINNFVDLGKAIIFVKIIYLLLLDFFADR